jgi:hypothetical protein
LNGGGCNIAPIWSPLWKTQFFLPVIGRDEQKANVATCSKH